MMEQLPVGMLLTSRDGQILEANDAAMSLLGHQHRESLLAENMKDIYADAEQHERLMEQMRGNGKVETSVTLLVSDEPRMFNVMSARFSGIVADLVLTAIWQEW